MERNVNKVEIAGIVGSEPKITTMESGASIVRFPVATNEVFKLKDGSFREETSWHSISAWSSKTLPDFSKIKKGMFVEVIGRLKYFKYKTKDGDDRFSTEIVALKISLPETNH
ncbi:MAG: single-stranded DNA-binding protein [Candidatus Egerieousia sp.]